MVITFDVAAFRAAYPQFEDMSDAALTLCWDRACVISRINTDDSPIEDVNERKILLFMLTCHVATLTQRGAETVGIMSNATEGSVSIGWSIPSSEGKGAWFKQTQCGWAFWQAMRGYVLGGKLYRGRC